LKWTTMPSEVFRTAAILAGPRRRTESQCLQYTENIGRSPSSSPAPHAVDGDAGQVVRAAGLIKCLRPGFQGWSIRTNPVMIVFDYDR
jgi:hypothetical protein